MRLATDRFRKIAGVITKQRHGGTGQRRDDDATRLSGFDGLAGIVENFDKAMLGVDVMLGFAATSLRGI
jgi:hypothetical protein